MRLIAVVMGANSDNIRTDEANQLLSYGFRFYETRKLYPAGTPLQQVRIWLGQEKEISVGPQHDLYVTLPQGQYDKLNVALNISKNIRAPAQQGTVLGTLTVHLDKETLIEQPIIALNTVPEAGFLSRSYDHIVLALHALWDKIIS
jgi:D-alanyl-D-alanine carboxypeptidase (penicillin-binding protein 5/6)